MKGKKTKKIHGEDGLFDLSGEVAVVVGGTGMLGGAIAEGLARAGAKVAIVGRNTERGLARVLAIERAGGMARFFEADATNRGDLRRTNRLIEKFLGAPTILVNAAGGSHPEVVVSPGNPIERIKLSDWQEHFLQNVGGILAACQEFGPPMCKRGTGSIINLASLAAHTPIARMPAYSAAKAAILNLSKFLAREWAPRGVRVNTITPGFIPAEVNRRMLLNEDGTPGPRAASIFNHTPMGRFGEPEELIGAVIFLASSRASDFVTGIDIPIDGGFLAQSV